MQHKYSYFDFLLDKSGGVLKNYLESEEKGKESRSLLVILTREIVVKFNYPSLIF